MLSRFITFLIIIAMLLCIAGCKKNEDVFRQGDYALEAPHVDPVDSAANDTVDTPITNPEASLFDPFTTMDDNSIDRAFSRFADEHGNELEGNTVLAYLYALKWQNEYELISKEFFLRELLYPLPEITWKREEALHSTHYFSKITAIEYANKWSESNKAIEQFEGIARYYKLIVYDCLARFHEYGVNIGIQTDEDELYKFLNDFHSYDQIPYENYRSEYEIPYDAIFPMLIVAALPDSDIYITSAPPFGAVLTVHGEEYFYNWDSGVPSPKEILPRLSLFDYDGDGIEELAVIICNGYGTGCYVEELIIVEINEDMSVTAISGQTIEALLYHRLSAYYDEISGELKVILDDQVLSLYFSLENSESEVEREFTGLDLRELIWFNSDNGILTVSIEIGCLLVGWGSAADYISFSADLLYNGATDISLANCHIAHD
jgi:hypothetical protein